MQKINALTLFYEIKRKKSLYELRLLLSLGEKKSEEKISQYVANAGFGAYKKL